jgi:hypothetical protein
MPRFEVVTQELVSAGAAVHATTGTLDGARAVVSQSDGALAGTPAAFAYATFLGSLGTVVSGLSTASSELSSALIAVADAYQEAEESATCNLSGIGE